MPILSHLKELRLRLLRCFIITILVFLACYFYKNNLLSILKQPLEQPLTKYSNLTKEDQTNSIDKKISDQDLECNCIFPKNYSQNLQKSKEIQVNLNCICTPKQKVTKSPLVFIGLPEVFFSELKIAFFLAIFFSFPYWIAELWAFALPALYKNEKKIFLAFIPSTFIFFIGGAAFGYFIVFPIGFDFFLSLSRPEEIIPSLTIGQYVSFAIKLLFAFGLVFEFPLLVLFLSRLGILTPKFMIKNTKYAIVFIFISSALLTPPDPFTMFLMAVPLSILYVISIFICYLVFNRKKARLKEQELNK